MAVVTVGFWFYHWFFHITEDVKAVNQLLKKRYVLQERSLNILLLM